ncbi:unnamed protein product [Chrysoparadoxa australica]
MAPLAFPACDGSCQTRPNPPSDVVLGAHLETQRRTPLGFPGGTLGAPGLPSPRSVSNAVADQADAGPRQNTRTNLLLIFMGQFIDHDLTLILADSSRSANIPASGDPDDVLGELPFPRSLTDGIDGRFPNVNSAWLNLGNIYGDEEDRCRALRADDSEAPGKMLTRIFFGQQEYLPLFSEVENPEDFETDVGPGRDATPIECGNFGECRNNAATFACGDPRCNEHLVLLAFTQLFVRNHNRLADLVIDEVDQGSLSDEDYSRLVFNTARLNNIFTWQKIVFEDWLPKVIGEDGIAILNDPSGPFARSFDGVGAEPTMDLLFSTAAFRFGHTGLGDTIVQANNKGKTTKEQRLSDLFFSPNELRQNPNVFHRIFNGLRMTPHEDLDTRFVDSVRNELFGNVDQPLDLFALNIQRGRDHGLASFNAYAAERGSTQYATFMELTGGDVAMTETLNNLYGLDQVDNADMFAAGLAEQKFGDSQLGELFTRVIIDQFARIRNADSFWFEEATDLIEPLSTLAEVIDKNTKAPEVLDGQSDAFLLP